MSLSVFSAIVNFFDNVDIAHVEGIMTLEDIMCSDVGGVGWGQKSLWVSEGSCFVKSLTPGMDLPMSSDLTAITWEPYTT